MPILDCNVNTCVHYADNCCCRNNILVEGTHASTDNETCCGNFDERRTGGCQNSAREAKLQLAVDCEAISCVYNESRKCRAEHIGISGPGAKMADQTKCASFKCC